MDRIFDLGEVAVFKTAKSAASAAATRAAEVVVRVPIQRAQDITDGSCRIIWGTETLLSRILLINDSIMIQNTQCMLENILHFIIYYCIFILLIFSHYT